MAIEKVIGHYVVLEREGSQLKGLCPFHAETKTSLRVNPEKGMFKCFQCGAGGDEISFVMEYLRISFAEAREKIKLLS